MFLYVPAARARGSYECQAAWIELGSGSLWLEGGVLACPLVESQGAGWLIASLCLRTRLIRFLARFPSGFVAGLSDPPAVVPVWDGTGRLS